MDEKQYPPIFKLFKGALQKRDITQQKIIDFRRWINGAKCPEEIKPDANMLLADAEAFLNANPPKPRSLVAKPPA